MWKGVRHTYRKVQLFWMVLLLVITKLSEYLIKKKYKNNDIERKEWYGINKLFVVRMPKMFRWYV